MDPPSYVFPYPATRIGIRRRADWSYRRKMTGRPTREEAAEYYFTYIDKVPGDDVLRFLDAQSAEVLRLLQSIDEAKSLHRYEPGKWSIRESVSHTNDAERVFAYRALWIARGGEAPLPGFDQDVFIANANADARPLSSHTDEFIAIRAATMSLLRSLAAEAWSRQGTASNNPVTVRALAYMIAGHVEHHRRILVERYL